jgi:hypothetical protein
MLADRGYHLDTSSSYPFGTGDQPPIGCYWGGFYTNGTFTAEVGLNAVQAVGAVVGTEARWILTPDTSVATPFATLLVYAQQVIYNDPAAWAALYSGGVADANLRTGYAEYNGVNGQVELDIKSTVSS